jgi:hypothetical protein
LSKRYQSLIERMRGEVADLDQIVERARQGWSVVEKAPAERYAYVDSVALNLHSFYSGLERLFELIAKRVDGNLPDGETWHRDLLQRMTQDLPDRRPAVISGETAARIDEFRRFRHVVRSAYTINLVPAKMAGLMKGLPELWPRLRAELLAFADYLEALDASLQRH